MGKVDFTRDYKMKLIAILMLIGIAHAEYPLPKNLSNKWLIESIPGFIAEKDRGGFFYQLAKSISPWAESGSQKSSVKIGTSSADILSSIRDNENLINGWIPTTFAIGITGRIEFFSFGEL